MYDVLYVEDERSSIRLVEEAFAESGASVRLHAVRTGAEALDILVCDGEDDRVLPDLVLLDLELREMSGLDVLERVRERTPSCSIPVVVFTNSGKTDHVRTAYEFGANAYVQKPTDFEDLVTFATRAVDFWQSDSQAAEPVR